MTIVATFVHSLIVGLFYYPPGGSSTNNATLGATCNASLTFLNGTLVDTPVVNAQLGYLVSAFIFAGIFIPPVILMLFCVPERKVPKKKKPLRRDGSVRHKQFTVWESFLTMITNRSFVCVTLIYLFSQLAIQFVQNNLILYIKYVLYRNEWFSYILLVLLGMACLSLPMWELMSRRWGKVKMYLVGALVGIACFLSAFFVDFYPTQLGKDVMIWVTAVVGGVSIGSLFLIPVAMLPDAITQDELRTGLRREAIFYAFFILFQKVALAVAVAISNFVLSASGYISPQAQCPDPVQPQATRLALSFMIGVVPAIIMALSLIALFFYPVTKELHLDTLKKIEEERQKNALITTDGEQTAHVDLE
jgi:GPH family glycoside/pentoside/hexuronide:cation symporter